MAERKISGQTYKVEPLLASEAIELYAEILRVAGPASGKLPAIIMGMLGGGEHASVMADVAALSALSEIVNSSGAPGIRELIQRIVEIAMVQTPSKDWRQVDLDGDFTGHLNLLLPVAKFVLEEQFRDFFYRKRGEWDFGHVEGGLTKHEVKRVAPNLNFFIYRPALASPPLCSFLECERVTLKQLLDMHEALDYRAATADKAMRSRKQ